MNACTQNTDRECREEDCCLNVKCSEDFRNSAIKNKIKFWNIRNCSLCDYECGYLFFEFEDCEVIYDSGCYCTNSRIIKTRNWNDVSEQYKLSIKNEKMNKKYNDFWEFCNDKENKADTV